MASMRLREPLGNPMGFRKSFGVCLRASLFQVFRMFASDGGGDNTGGQEQVSFEPEEVSRQLISLAEKYCKEGVTVLPDNKFESFETKEERAWDCLDTVEFVLDAEDMFGIVIPDEVADSFETIQDVVNYVVKRGTENATA